VNGESCLLVLTALNLRLFCASFIIYRTIFISRPFFFTVLVTFHEEVYTDHQSFFKWEGTVKFETIKYWPHEM
jgi:hypothetical protein